MSGFVYIWRDRKHSRYYIGSHWGSFDDGYICSSTWMKQAYKHRPQDFKRRILKTITSSRHELREEEQRWLHMIEPKEQGKKYYNLTLHTTPSWHLNEERKQSVKDRISQSVKQYFENPTHRQKTSEATKKAMTDPLIRQKISQAKKGKTGTRQGAKLTPQQKENALISRSKYTLKGRKYYNLAGQQGMYVPGQQPYGWHPGCIDNGWHSGSRLKGGFNI